MFRVGDKVMLRHGLEDGEYYGSMDYHEDQYGEWLDLLLTVDEVDLNDNSLTVAEDEQGTWFSFEMLDKKENTLYKVGMQVQVISDLDVNKRYGGQCVTDSMVENRGKICRITEMGHNGEGVQFHLNDPSGCWYTPPMVDIWDIDEEGWTPDFGNPKPLEVGDIVVVKKGLVPNQRYGGVAFPDNMAEKVKGKHLTVLSIVDSNRFYVKENSFIYSLEMVDVKLPIRGKKEENKDMMELLKWLKKEFKKDSESITFENLDDFAYYGGIEYVYEKILKKLEGGKK